MDVSGDLKGTQISVRGGRQYELDRTEASSATVPFNDQSRKYDPANRSSPYAPNVIPNRKIRLRAAIGSTGGPSSFGAGTFGSSLYGVGLFGTGSYLIFRGFVERWPTRWQDPNWASVEITASDGFEPLTAAGVAGGALLFQGISSLFGNHYAGGLMSGGMTPGLGETVVNNYYGSYAGGGGDWSSDNSSC